MTGKTISHYKILEKLGEGGMGVVYKAFDRRLERHVALKILHIHLVTDEEVRVRFIHEARAASALNHPNICTIYEIARARGMYFIAMEYVDGKTVREIITNRGPLPKKRVLDISNSLRRSGSNPSQRYYPSRYQVGQYHDIQRMLCQSNGFRVGQA